MNPSFHPLPILEVRRLENSCWHRFSTFCFYQPTNFSTSAKYKKKNVLLYFELLANLGLFHPAVFMRKIENANKNR